MSLGFNSILNLETELSILSTNISASVTVESVTKPVLCIIKTETDEGIITEEPVMQIYVENLRQFINFLEEIDMELYDKGVKNGNEN